MLHHSGAKTNSESCINVFKSHEIPTTGLCVCKGNYKHLHAKNTDVLADNAVGYFRKNQRRIHGP